MTELLAAIPRLFQRQRVDAYANLREGAQRDLTNERAVMRTVHQMDRAYEQIVKVDFEGTLRAGQKRPLHVAERGPLPL